MQFKIRNHLYNHTLEIFKNRQKLVFKVKYSLEIFNNIILFLRGFIAICSYLIGNESFQYWRNDPFTYYLYLNFKEQFLYYTMIMMISFISNVLGIYYVCFRGIHIIFYDLIVINMNQIRNCLISPSEQKKFLNIHYSGKLTRLKMKNPFFWKVPPIRFLWKQIYWYLTKQKLALDAEIIDQSKLNKYHLKSLPNISIELRLKMAKTVYNLDKIFYIINLELVLIILFVGYRYTSYIINVYPLNHYYQYVILLLENLLLMNYYAITIQMGMISSTMLIINIYHKYTIVLVNHTLKQLSMMVRNNQNKSIPYKQTFNRSQMMKQENIFKKIYQMHSFLCNLYMKLFDTVWGDFLYHFLILSLPLNVMCILALRLKNNQVYVIISFSLILISNAIIIILVLLIMAWETETLHQTKKYLPKIIKQIRNIRLKLQYNNWYYRLSTRKKYGPYITNIGPMTYNKVIEVSSIFKKSIEFYF